MSPILNDQIYSSSSASNESYMKADNSKFNIIFIYLDNDISYAAAAASVENRNGSGKPIFMHYMFPSSVAEVSSVENAYEKCVKYFDTIKNVDAIDAVQNDDIILGDMAEQYTLYYPNTSLRSLFKPCEIFVNDHVHSFNLIESIYSTLFRRFHCLPNETKVIGIMPTTIDVYEMLTLEEVIDQKFSQFSSAILMRSCEFLLRNNSRKSTTAGLVVEWTTSGILLSPIINGEMMKEDIYKINYGKEYFMELLSTLLQDDIYFAALNEKDKTLIIKQILKHYCQIVSTSSNPITENDEKNENNVKERCTFVLTGGKVFEMKLSNHIKYCLNLMFDKQNQILKNELEAERRQTLPEAIISAILLCPNNAHQELFKNIILSHDLSLIPGLMNRLHQDMAKILSPQQNFQVLPFEWEEEKIESCIQEICNVTDDSIIVP